MNNFKTLYKKVEKILEIYPHTRNSDMLLFERMIDKFYPKVIKNGKRELPEGIEYIKAIFIKDLYSLPRQSDIERMRRKIQNDEKRFLPTIWEIAQLRKWKKEEWLKNLGYKVDNKDQVLMDI